MGFLSRLAQLIKSNLNDLISTSEDPEKMLNQIIVDMNTQLVEAKKQVAVAIADQIADFLTYGIAHNAVNAPAVDAATLEALAPHVILAERIGSFLAQRLAEPIRKLEVTYLGELEGRDTRAVRGPPPPVGRIRKEELLLVHPVGRAVDAGGGPVRGQPRRGSVGEALAIANTMGIPPQNFVVGDSDGNIAAWSWSFGDGGASTQQNPSYSYTAGGTYTVTLTVTDDDGDTDSTTQSVTVAEPPNAAPTAAFSASCTDLDCSFTDTSSDSDGTVTAWAWNFGDGNSSSDEQCDLYTHRPTSPYRNTYPKTATARPVRSSSSTRAPTRPSGRG